MEVKKANVLSQIDSLVTSENSDASNVIENNEDNFDYTGSLCSAIFRSRRTGTLVRHSIMVLEFQSEVDGESLVKVMLLHPTELSMVPCAYYLQDRCTFGERCKFSHGLFLKQNQILEYEEPDRRYFGVST